MNKKLSNTKNGSVAPKSKGLTIKEVYGDDFGVRSDKKLQKFLKVSGFLDLAKLLKNSKGDE